MAQYCVARNAPLAYFYGVQIVRTRRYVKDMERLGASAGDMARLEAEIAANPQAGDVIPGLSGRRKYVLRWPAKENVAAGARSAF